MHGVASHRKVGCGIGKGVWPVTSMYVSGLYTVLVGATQTLLHNQNENSIVGMVFDHMTSHMTRLGRNGDL